MTSQNSRNPKPTSDIAARRAHYESLEQARYNGFWRSLNDGFTTDERHYASRTAQPQIVHELKKLTRNLPQSHNSHLLDIGCGNARNSVAAAQLGFHVTAFDIADEALKIARRLTHETNTEDQISLHHAPTSNMPAPDNSVDVALDAGCLHHLRKAQWQPYRAELLRTLKPGATYILLTFNTASGIVPGVRPTLKQNWKQRRGHYNHFFTEPELDNSFGRHFTLQNRYCIQKPDSALRFFLSIYKKN